MQTNGTTANRRLARRLALSASSLLTTMALLGGTAHAFDLVDLRTRLGLELQPGDFIRPNIEFRPPSEPVQTEKQVEPVEERPTVKPLPVPIPVPVEAYKTFVRTKKQLAAAGLFGETPLAAEYVTALQRTLGKGLARNRYWLLFRGIDAPEQEHVIRNRQGLQLTSILRVDRTRAKCSSMFAIDDEEIGGGASLENATRGICGVIAVLHSLEKLDLVERADIADGAHLRRNVVDGMKRRYQNRRTNQMSKKKLRRAHEDFGSGACRQQNDALTSNVGGLDNFVKALNGYVNDPDRKWDCTLYVRSNSGRNATLAHYEHVTAMTTSNSGRGQGNRTILNAEITTLNGFAQGNQSSTVPANPGSNTWSLRPGGTPPMSMTGARNAAGGSDRETRDRLAAVSSVQRVSFICCPAPAAD